MNIKRFRRVCNVSSIILKILAVLAIVITSLSMYQVLSGNPNVWFNYEGPSFSMFSSGHTMGGILITDAEYRLAATIISPFIVLVSSYVFWKGSQLFKRLADGETPFNFEFTKSLKHLSLVLILSDIITPILYSIILSTIYDNGHEVIVGLTSSFVIGIILYTISEIFYYGIELQQLADETV